MCAYTHHFFYHLVLNFSEISIAKYKQITEVNFIELKINLCQKQSFVCDNGLQQVPRSKNQPNSATTMCFLMFCHCNNPTRYLLFVALLLDSAVPEFSSSIPVPLLSWIISKWLAEHRPCDCSPVDKEQEEDYSPTFSFHKKNL